eukprot:3543438-Alexandrium_andersonii.AAC.1
MSSASRYELLPKIHAMRSLRGMSCPQEFWWCRIGSRSARTGVDPAAEGARSGSVAAPDPEAA